MPTEHPLRIVIAGAGIAGLATALRLHRDGHRVLVAERAPARRTGGYLVNLLGPGFDAAERLGLVPALRERDQGIFTSLLVRADGSGATYFLTAGARGGLARSGPGLTRSAGCAPSPT